MAKEVGNITEVKEDEDKTFKGPGIEGKKGLQEKPDEQNNPDVNPQDHEDEKKARAKALKEKKALLKDLKDGDERLTKEEDARKFIDGQLVAERKVRRRAIENLEAEIKSEG